VDESALDIVEDPSIGIVWHAPSAVANASTDTSLFMTPPHEFPDRFRALTGRRTSK
jgi:hypothetical protein